MAFPPYKLPQSCPVAPTFDPKIEANRLYGKSLILRELELIKIDPDQDYTCVPGLKATVKKPGK